MAHTKTVETTLSTQYQLDDATREAVQFSTRMMAEGLDIATLEAIHEETLEKLEALYLDASLDQEQYQRKYEIAETIANTLEDVRLEAK